MSEMLELVLDDVNEKSEEVIQGLKKQLAKTRTGRASLSVLDDVKAEYYGALTVLKNMSNISIPEPRLIVIQPFDPVSLKDIEKAIQVADLGLNPLNDGKVIRISIPELTEERRKDITKIVKKTVEDFRVSVRQARRDANSDLKKAEKDKDISEDELHSGMDKVQKIVDDAIKKIDKIGEAKEKEVLEI